MLRCSEILYHSNLPDDGRRYPNQAVQANLRRILHQIAYGTGLSGNRIIQSQQQTNIDYHV